ncbi:replication fork protection component Swi3-domain-containing protein [Phyllosticta capitalensis]|uniref:replication fork protection component Swi3-domain-containing protein n=1 Tax=Phyllosticta capitalensis TaxID=121624 RepID=UPI0031310A0D
MSSSKAQQPRQRDDLDNLLGDDSEMQDVFDAVENGSSRDEPPRATNRQQNSGLGIDEEVTIAKKRTPIPKLDQERLLSPAGIPKLRRISKDKLRFKGKGHEFSDVARLLNMYQFWLDDLYPRAKFADGLAIIEKLGHKKRMQIMRKAWIDESKPKPTVEFDAEASEPAQNPETTKATTPASSAQADVEDRVMGSQRDDRQPAFHSASPQNAGTTSKLGDDEFDEDDLDALMAEETTEGVEKPQQPLPPSSTKPGEPDEPDEDELDALLAAEESGEAPIRPQEPAVEKRDMQPDQDDEFTDEMEAMRGMEDW